MLYRVFFTTGQSLVIDENRYKNILDPQEVDMSEFLDNGYPYIDLSHVTHIIPEVQEEPGHLIQRPSPQDIKDEEKRKLDQIRSNPTQLIQRIKTKAEGDEI